MTDFITREDHRKIIRVLHFKFVPVTGIAKMTHNNTCLLVRYGDHRRSRWIQNILSIIGTK